MRETIQSKPLAARICVQLSVAQAKKLSYSIDKMECFWRKAKDRASGLVDTLIETISHLNQEDAAIHRQNWVRIQQTLNETLRKILDTIYLRNMNLGRKTAKMADHLVTSLLDRNAFEMLLASVSRVEFPSLKLISSIWTNLLYYRAKNGDFPLIDHLTKVSTALGLLMDGYSLQFAHHPLAGPVALACGQMLRATMQVPRLCHLLLSAPPFHRHGFTRWFGLSEGPDFAVSTDAFSTFKTLLTCHRRQVASFFNEHYDLFTQYYGQLLTSNNYATQRMSLAFLGHLLCEPHNQLFTMRFINDIGNLILIANIFLGVERRPALQMEAYHILKLFISYPRKSTALVASLVNLRARLVARLSSPRFERMMIDFACQSQSELVASDGFKEEKAHLVSILNQLSHK